MDAPAAAVVEAGSTPSTASRAHPGEGEGAGFERELDATLERGFRRYRNVLLVETIRHPFSTRRRYARLLVNVRFHAESVERVLAVATAAAEERSLELHADLAEHALEERGHGGIAGRDLEALPVDGELRSSLEPCSAQLALSAYTETIARTAPVAVLGFLCAAEGLTYRFARFARRALSRCGVPENALGFLKLHAEVDREHFPKLRSLALRHARTPEERRGVLEAARVAGDLIAVASASSD